jgi:hypothetical protein
MIHFRVIVLLFAVAAVQAATISGTFWSVPSTTADNIPTLGNVPGAGATLWGTFNATAISFSADGGYSLGGFLRSGAATNTTYLNGATGATSLTNVLFEFTGAASFTNGQSFSVLHDDGVNLYVNNQLVLGVPGITPPVTTNYIYNGPTGNYNFDFIYANGPATQAAFSTTLSELLVNPAPEPFPLLLLPVGLAGLWLARRCVAS